MLKTIVKRARLGVALLLLPTTLFAPIGASASPNNIDSLTVGIVASAGLELYPLSIRERDPLNLLALCYEGLVALDDNDRPIPALATSWDPPTGNSKRWTFHLRPDVTFQNGKPLTAADVCATLDRIVALGGYDEERKSDIPYEERGLYANIVEAYVSSWTAVDDLTVEIIAARPYYGLLNAMTFPILPADEVGQMQPAGTGPYKIAQYEPGDRLWLTSWQGWWKGTMPNVQNIMAYIYPNTENALSAFDGGEIDVTMTRSMSATRYSGSLRSFSLSYRTRQLEVLLMHHNENKQIIRDEEVRKAIILAIDRSALITQVYQGMATSASTPIAPGTWLDRGMGGEDYNPALARATLEQAGWKLDSDGVRSKSIEGTLTLLKLNILVYDEPGNSVRHSAAGMIAEMLGAVGISCSVESNTYDRVKERLEAGNFDLALCAMNLDVVPDSGFMLTTIDTNYCRYRSETMAELIRTLRTQVGENEYSQTMSEVQQQFLADAPFMCLYFRNGALMTRDTFTAATSMRELELFRGIEEW